MTATTAGLCHSVLQSLLALSVMQHSDVMAKVQGLAVQHALQKITPAVDDILAAGDITSTSVRQLTASVVQRQEKRSTQSWQTVSDTTDNSQRGRQPCKTMLLIAKLTANKQFTQMS